jgi:hypothetical protein
MWCYTRDGGGRHAIVFAYTERGLEFFEPQTGRFVQLSGTEIQSRFAVRI